SIVQAVQCGVDLGDQLALAVAGAKLDGAVGFRGGAVGEIGGVLGLVLEGLEGFLGLLEGVLPPGQGAGAGKSPLALIHERLFVGRPVVLVLLVGGPIAVDGMQAVMAISIVPVGLVAVQTVTIVAVYAVLPLLILHLTPPYSNEPPCSRGELIVARPWP